MSTVTPNYEIDYEDKAFTDITDAKNEALTNNQTMYDNMIGGVDEKYQGIADTVQSNADKMAQIQQENTDFQIQQIEQQKEQAQKDYTKEQSGAYGDFIRQTNQHGVNAEQMAMQGLTGSGYSESLKVAEFTAYQNRVATARDGLNKVMMNYDNNIQQAILQNNSNIAQIYSEASLKQAEILLEGFQYKNNLLIEQANKELELKQFYSNEWQRQLDQINTENALAENVRQYNETTRIQQEQWQKEYELQLSELEERKRQFDAEMERLKKLDDEEAKRKAEELRIASEQAQAEITKLKAEAKAYTVTPDPVTPDPVIDKPAGIPKGYTDFKIKASVLPSSTIKSLGLSGAEKIYQNGNKYIAIDSEGMAVDVTKYVTFSNGYQPKYINGKALQGQGTIKSNGLAGNSAVSFLSTDKQASQTLWKAGSNYYVWDGKSKTYKDVTSAYQKAKAKESSNATPSSQNRGFDRYEY